MKTLTSTMMVAAAAFAALGSLTTSTASAAEERAVVYYGDLDPSQDADAERLYVRLSRASEIVCDAHDSDARILAVYEQIRACERSALTRAVTQVASPALAVALARRFPETARTRVTSAPGTKSVAVG